MLARVRLSYSVCLTRGYLDYSVGLQFTLPTYGGLKWWFICPLVVNNRACGRRVRKLFMPPGGSFYGCRHCYELRYRSRSADRKHRVLAKTQTLRMRLGGTESIIDALPAKPKRMRWRTYLLMRERAAKLEAETWWVWANSGAERRVPEPQLLCL